MIPFYFKRLEKNTGTFLMFSQYVEDITREGTQSCYYHVTPSKFIALDINYTDWNNDNISLFFQNYFENGCAVSRSEIIEDWTPEHSKNLFWSAMLGENGLLTRSEESQFNKHIVNEIKYIGDINLQSYNEHNGMGYSEIYCHIPSDAKCQTHSILNNQNKLDKEDKVLKSGEIVEGYTYEDFANMDSLDKNWGIIGQDEISYTPYSKFHYSWENPDIYSSETDDSEFKINTIVVLYDVVTKTPGTNANEIIYRNIPMGIYFTGILKNDIMTNSITKYVSHEDIYNSGTSYGLRICSRFTVTPNQDNIKTVESSSSSDNEYSLLSQLLTQMSVSQKKMDEVVNNISINTQQNKDMMASFKNYRTNVPYVKQINGEKYWYVNGRPVSGLTDGIEEHEYIPYNDQEILDMLAGTSSFVINMTALDENNSDKVDASVLLPNETKRITVSWEITLKKELLDANNIQSFTINDVERKPNAGYVDELVGDIKNKSRGYFTELIGTSKEYNAIVKYDDMTTKGSTKINFVYPSFIGVAYKDEINTQEKLINKIKKFEKKINTSKSVNYTYSTISKDNGDTQHIIYAYPKSYGTLTSIKDTDYNYISDFNRDQIDITFDTGRKETYYVYIDDIPSYVENYTLKFN